MCLGMKAIDFFLLKAVIIRYYMLQINSLGLYITVFNFSKVHPVVPGIFP